MMIAGRLVTVMGLVVTVICSFLSFAPPPLAVANSQQYSLTCSSGGSGSNEEKTGDMNARHCLSWPKNQVPLEHRDFSCNRAFQNLEWSLAHEVAKAAPKEELIPDDVYLRLPEEKTWVCPLGTADDDDVASRRASNFLNIGRNDKGGNVHAGGEGHPTRWVLYNEASSPIILTRVNALGFEVSATDGAYPAHSNTAVYPHGPIVLPGQMAVINGVQGHLFAAREYEEVVFSLNPTVENDTVSYDSKGVTHVLGYPGRVLMKHRMGLIHVNNDSGALCPESWGLERNNADLNDYDDGRRGNPRDSEPLCNVLRKAFINKVGCPIDIYFAPQNTRGESSTECEKFTQHLGSINDFLATDHPDLDGHSSPLKFENTYNGHSFIARMTHDQSFVARIEIDHDIVRDCPEPRRSASSVEVYAHETVMLNTPIVVANATKSNTDSALGCNAAILTPIPEAKRPEEKRNIIWCGLNHSGINGVLHTAT